MLGDVCYSGFATENLNTLLISHALLTGRLKWAGHVEIEGKRPLAPTGSEWEDNIKMDLKGIG